MKTVLVADDSKVVRDKLVVHLRSQGFEVFEASDGQDAWDAMLSGKVKPSICLLDLNMPKLGGLELCEKMRGHAEYKDTPVLMVTAQSDPSLKEKAKALGIRGWVLKPVIPESIAQVVSKLIGN